MVILLFPPPAWWDYRHTPAHLEKCMLVHRVVLPASFKTSALDIIFNSHFWVASMKLKIGGGGGIWAIEPKAIKIDSKACPKQRQQLQYKSRATPTGSPENECLPGFSDGLFAPLSKMNRYIFCLPAFSTSTKGDFKGEIKRRQKN